MRARRVTPKASEPIAPRKAQEAPARTAATAWLAPLPPGTITKSVPSMVSPGRGSAGAIATRSMLALPTTATRVCGTAVSALADAQAARAV